MSNLPLKTLLQSRWKSLITFFLLIAAIAYSNSTATFPSVMEWYPTLNRPSWTPPNWVFGPVWMVLYIFLAISGWLLWNNLSGNSVKEKLKNPALIFYFAQLVFNGLWSYLFFAMRHPVYGLVCISTLLVCAFLTLFYSNKSGQKAVSAMFIPYCLWLSYAAQLNAAIVMMN